MTMNLQKNNAAIIAIVVLFVVCAGTFFGVRSMNDNLENSSTVASSSQTTASVSISTTAPVQVTEAQVSLVPTTLPVATTKTLEQISQQSDTQDVITTFAMVPTSSAELNLTESAAQQSTSETTTTNPVTSAVQVTQQTTAPAQNSIISNSTLAESGLAGYLYNPNGKFYYTSSDPWQRAIGYNELFDIGAGFVSIYMDTIRFKFEYANKDWLIQFWKGQYGFLFVGHEIGVYTKPKDRTVEHYDAATENDENALYMSMTGYRKGEEIYSREYAKYWWCTGFVPGQLDNFSDRSELSLKCRITMKDEEMLQAFTKALQKSGLVEGKDFISSGLDVFVSW